MKCKKFTKLKKRLSIAAIVCMLFQIFPVGFLSSNKVFAATGFRDKAVAGEDVVLGGNYIEVGISKSGSFGTKNPAPIGFHPTNSGVGLRVDGDGFDTGNAPTTGDFFLPGQPEESFTIGYKVGSNTVAATKYTNAERMGQTDINTVTTDTTSGDTLSALTSGNTSDNNLTIEQKISFKVNDKFFKNTVTYTNKGTSTLYDVRYMRSFDPDQDADLHSKYETYNCVLENFPQDSRAIVRASGGYTKEPVFFISTDSRARASTFGFSNRDPYSTDAYNVDGSKLKTSEALEDQAIALTFALGNLAPLQSTTFEYYTSLDPDYNSGLANIMGSLGIQINNGAAKTNSLEVSLNLSGQNIAQMQFSNDNSNWSNWENYASTKAWSLTGGVGSKTVYVHFKDSSGNISNINASIEYIDITAPIFSVSGNPTTWTSSDATLAIIASDAVSGLNTGGAYSFDDGATWTTSNTKSFSSNANVKIKVKDNSGNISSQTIVIDKIDKTAPNTAVIANKDNYVDSKWFNVNQTITASFTKTEGFDEKLQNKVDNGTWTDGASVDVNTEGKHTVSFRVIDSLGRTSAEQTVNVNIDKTAPVNAKITIKDKEFTSFLNTITFGMFFKDTVAVAITADTAISGISKIEYQKVSEASDYAINGTWVEGSSFNVNPDEKFIVYARITDNAGNYVIINSDGVIVDETNPALALTPDTNSWSKVNVNVKVNASDNLAGVKVVSYTTDEAVPQTGTVTITGGQGNITLTNEGQYILTVTAEDNSSNTITASQSVKIDKTAPIITGANNSSSYFIGRAIKLTDDFGEIAGATYKNGTDTETSFKDGDLFEQAGNYVLTLMDKAGNSNTISFEIKALPKVSDVVYTSDCKALIDSIRSEFNSHSDLPELYKADVDNQIKALEDRYSELGKKLIVYDAKTDLTVTGIDGTLFTTDVYLVVTPINVDTNETIFSSASKNVENASKYISALEGKELLALYDVSLFRDNIKIQPDGMVKVKIKIPEELRNRTGFDIVHIADNGTVTSMNAVVEGEYLVFTTTHFSDYAIVANSITKEIPKTGSVVDFDSLIIVGFLISLIGIVLIRKRIR